jgi:histidinol dehydrogenase
MMKRISYEGYVSEELTRLFSRLPDTFAEIDGKVRMIVADVARNGDGALSDYTSHFDGVDIEEFKVPEDEIDSASKSLDPALFEALRKAHAHIEMFHKPQLPKEYVVHPAQGVSCWRAWRPIDCVGLYIPGGTAPLLSTVLMLGVPAKIAGCKHVVLCTPPGRNGAVASVILAAAKLAGVHDVYRVGGAQAIAAMACGTSTIPKVDKIFGPGNRYVAAAKAIVTQSPYSCAIDLYAGPTELLIVADQHGHAPWVAADLLAQAEHGMDSRLALITDSAAFADRVEQEIEKQLPALKRKETIENALERAFIVITKSVEEAIHLSNTYAPEHLILDVQNAESFEHSIQNAGSVFLGGRSSAVYGDYSSGTNHTLPTNATARFSGGVTVESFMKPLFFQSVSERGEKILNPITEALAMAEGLDAHAHAAKIRDVK